MIEEDLPPKPLFSSRAGTEDSKGKDSFDDVYHKQQSFKLRKEESKHLRLWDEKHSRALYWVVRIVGLWGVVLVGFLILPVWWKLLHGDMKVLSDEVWIVIITAPLLAVSGLSWATIHALSGKKNLPAINTKAFATLGGTSED